MQSFSTPGPDWDAGSSPAFFFLVRAKTLFTPTGELGSRGCRWWASTTGRCCIKGGRTGALGFLLAAEHRVGGGWAGPVVHPCRGGAAEGGAEAVGGPAAAGAEPAEPILGGSRMRGAKPASGAHGLMRSRTNITAIAKRADAQPPSGSCTHTPRAQRLGRVGPTRGAAGRKAQGDENRAAAERAGRSEAEPWGGAARGQPERGGRRTRVRRSGSPHRGGRGGSKDAKAAERTAGSDNRRSVAATKTCAGTPRTSWMQQNARLSEPGKAQPRRATLSFGPLKLTRGEPW